MQPHWVTHRPCYLTSPGGFYFGPSILQKWLTDVTIGAQVSSTNRSLSTPRDSQDHTRRCPPTPAWVTSSCTDHNCSRLRGGGRQPPPPRARQNYVKITLALGINLWWNCGSERYFWSIYLVFFLICFWFQRADTQADSCAVRLPGMQSSGLASSSMGCTQVH